MTAYSLNRRLCIFETTLAGLLNVGCEEALQLVVGHTVSERAALLNIGCEEALQLVVGHTVSERAGLLFVVWEEAVQSALGLNMPELVGLADSELRFIGDIWLTGDDNSALPQPLQWLDDCELPANSIIHSIRLYHWRHCIATQIQSSVNTVPLTVTLQLANVLPPTYSILHIKHINPLEATHMPATMPMS